MLPISNGFKRLADRPAIAPSPIAHS